MIEQQFKEKCCKEHEISPATLEKEDQKTSKQIEVLTNSSVEMSLKTDSDLLRTSVVSKLKRQRPHSDENFQFEPNGSRPISFYLSEENL